MELIVWLFLILAVPLALFIAAYAGYRTSDEPFAAVLGAILGTVIHIVLAGLSFFPMFVVVYSFAHPDRMTRSGYWLLRLGVLGIEILYALIAFSYCSVLYGRKRPWPLRVPKL